MHLEKCEYSLQQICLLLLFRNKRDEVWWRGTIPFTRFSDIPGKNRRVLGTEAYLFRSEVQLANSKPNMD